MRRDKVTEPVTDSKEKARRAQRNDPQGKGGGSPSRASAPRSGGESEKKSGSAPKKGGRTRSLG
jgi:hypothetical protein